MKFLEDRELSQLNSFLAHVNLGDHVVTGQLENYSCAFVVCDDALRFFIRRRPERERESFFFRVERTRTSLFSVVFFFVVVLLLLLFRRTDRYRQSSNVR